MGYVTMPGGGGHTIRTFSPDDTENSIYINSSLSLTFQEILDRAQRKWPEIKMEELIIGAEHIHTDCIGYDKYDPGDYTDYILVTALPEYFQRINKNKENISCPCPSIVHI